MPADLKARRALFAKRRASRAAPRARGYAPKAPRALVVEYAIEIRRSVAAVAAALQEALIPDLPLYAAPSPAKRLDSDPLARALDRARKAGYAAARLPRSAGARTAYWATRETARALGVTVDGMRGEAAVEGILGAWTRENVGLIRGLVDSVLEKVEALVRTAVPEGLRVEALATQIQERISVGESRALLIARDQTLKLNADVAQARQTAAGVVSYTWSTSRDERVRGNPDGKYPNDLPSHWELDGKPFLWADPPPAGPDGEPSHPGQAIQCRCVAIPILQDLFPALTED